MKSIKDIFLELRRPPASFRKEYADEVIQEYLNKLWDKGIEIGTYLGHGTYGAAYEAGNNRVLKITMDNYEANSAKAIEGKTLKNVYRVYEVFQFNGSGWYGVLQEKLSPIEKEMEDILSGEAGAVLRNFAKGSVEAFQAEQEIEAYHPEHKEALYQIMDGIEQLQNEGITFADVHRGNILKRGSEYVIIDIGQSLSPEQSIEEI